jgi:hypothetical protein
MRPPARRSISICSASLDLKWANSPLLDILRSSASRPIVTPSTPMRVASASAWPRMASRVRSPFGVREALRTAVVEDAMAQK